MRRLRRLAAGAALSAVLLLLPGLAGAAAAVPRLAAALSPGKYTLVMQAFTAAAHSANGGYVSCPAGQRAVTGGVFFSTSAGPVRTFTSGWLADSSVTTDGKGRYGAGLNNTSAPLTVNVSAQCLPASQLNGAVTVTRQFTGAPGAPWDSEGGYASCPQGMRILTGGAYFNVPGAAPDPANQYHLLSGSTATFDRFGWYADGRWYGTGQQPQTLNVVLRCLPAAALAASTLFTQDLLMPGGDSISWAYLHCPAGTRAYTGGAFWHRPGAGPDPALSVRTWTLGNTATFDAQGWFAAGSNVGADGTNLVLTLDVRCLPAQ